MRRVPRRRKEIRAGDAKNERGKWIFWGRMLPVAAILNIPNPIRFPIKAGNIWQAELVLHIRGNQVVVEVHLKGEPPDVYTLRNEVVGCSHSIVDFISVFTGRWLEIQVDAVLTPEGELVTFDGRVPIVSDLARANSLPELLKVKDDSTTAEGTLRQAELDVGRLLELYRQVGPFLPHALADLRYAMGIRATDTPFYCYRALESLCHFFMSQHGLNPNKEGDRRKGWDIMHQALRTQRTYIRDLQQRAEEVRHGRARPISDAERARCLERTWQIVYRFFVYALGGFKPLGDDVPELR